MQLLDRYLDFLYVRTLIDSYLHNGSAIDADYCTVSLIMAYGNTSVGKAV